MSHAFRTSIPSFLCLMMLAACVPLLLGAGCPAPGDMANPGGDQVASEPPPTEPTPGTPDDGGTGPQTPVAVQGDLNGDGVVNQADVDILVAAFDSGQGDARFNADADLNGDGRIDLLDIQIMNSLFK